MRFDKKYLVEFLGTAIFMFVVCGFAMFVGAENNDWLQKYFNFYANMGAFLIAFVAGLTYMLLYLAFSKVTVCHFNPIFSFAYLLDGRMGTKEFIAYMESQVLGAVLGVGLVGKLIENMGITDKTRGTIEIKRFYNSEGKYDSIDLVVGVFKGKLINVKGKMGSLYPEAVAFILEVVLAFVLVWVFLKINSDKNIMRLRGVFISISMVMVYWVGIPYTTTLLNPAKEMAAMLVNAILEQELLLKELWIFLIGPIAGASIAVGVYKGYEMLEGCKQLIGSMIFVIFSTEILGNLIFTYSENVRGYVYDYEEVFLSAIGNFLVPIGIAGAFLLAHFLSGEIRITMFNPAVSLAQFVSKQISAKDCIHDIISQIIGMFLGFISFVFVKKEIFRKPDLSCGNSFLQLGNMGLVATIILIFILYSVLIGMALYLNEKLHIFSMFMMAGIMIFVNVIAIRFIGVIDNPVRSILIGVISKKLKDGMVIVGIMLVIALSVGLLYNKMLKVLQKSYIREMIGTYMFMLFGVGGAMSIGLQLTKNMGLQYMVGIVATTMLFGLVYVIFYYSFEQNAQFNPVISMAQWFNGTYSLKETVVNICMQVIGSIGAFATLVGIYKMTERTDGTLVEYMTVRGKAPSEGSVFGYFSVVFDVDIYSKINKAHWQVFLVEIIVTMTLFVVAANVLKKNKRNMFAGLIMGVSISVASLFGIAYNNSIGNVAKDIASLIFNLLDGNDKVLLSTVVAFVGALSGILLGMLVYKINLKYFREFIGMCIYIILAFGVSMNFRIYLYSHTFYTYSDGYTSVSNISNILNYVVIAIAFSLSYVIIYYGFGKENEAHFNPLVTIALWINKKIKLISALFHILFQMLGAIVGVNFIYWLHVLIAGRFDYSGYQALCECWDPIRERDCGVVANVVYARGIVNPDKKEIIVAFIVELIFTCLIVLAILYVNNKKYRFLGASGIITAGVLLISYLMAIPFTGGSFNPVRSLASAIINEILGYKLAMKQIWIFLLAPTLGALLAVLIFRLLYREKKIGKE